VLEAITIYRLLEVAKKRHGIRDHALLMVIPTAYASEAIQMRRDQLVKRSTLWVARLKNLLSVEHPIAGDELRGAIKRYSPPAPRTCLGTSGATCALIKFVAL
jgi:hypothetical protein